MLTTNMGERIGFRVKDKNGVSAIFRQQFMSAPQEVVENTWNTLLSHKTFVDKDYSKLQLVHGKVGDGMLALRNDLDIGRAFAALVYSNYEPPFNSIESDVNCDITDHGLVEIDVSDYKHWKVYHYEVDWHDNFDVPSTLDEDSKTLYAEMTEKGYKQLAKLETLDWC